MFDEKITQFSDLPLDGKASVKSDRDRKKTDIICTIIGALFAITMLILAFALMNTGNLQQMQTTTNKVTSLQTLIGSLAAMDSTTTIHLYISQTYSILTL